nr:hypothetical protein Itr_chr01CG04860 [Ipomoea trifida]
MATATSTGLEASDLDGDGLEDPASCSGEERGRATGGGVVRQLCSAARWCGSCVRRRGAAAGREAEGVDGGWA